MSSNEVCLFAFGLWYSKRDTSPLISSLKVSIPRAVPGFKRNSPAKSSESNAGTGAHPNSCKESRGRPHPFSVQDCPLLSLTYPRLIVTQDGSQIGKLI